MEERRTSKQSDTQKPGSFDKATTPTEVAETEISSPVKAEDGHVKPVRVAPPPPPGAQKNVSEEPTVSGEYAATAEQAPIQSEFGDPSQFYQGYGGGKLKLL
jgi:hypothetical protein